MKIKSSVLALSLATLLGTQTTMAENPYWGLGLGFNQYEEDGLRDDANLNGVYVRLGTHLNDYVSGEIRAGLGGDDEIDVFGYDVDLDLKHHYGAYVRGGFYATPRFYPYAIAGVTRAKFEASIGDFSVDESVTDFSYGLGADFDLTDRTSLNFEYMQYLDKDNVDFDGFNIGMSWHF